MHIFANMQVSDRRMGAEIPAEADEVLAKAAGDAARLFRAMGHAQRLRMLCMLLKTERASGEIARDLGIREPAASQQLALLKSEGLIEPRRDGQRIFYRIADPIVARLVSVLYEEFCMKPRA
jgi:DNA-binding transcriptional ArsR family regulator